MAEALQEQDRGITLRNLMDLLMKRDLEILAINDSLVDTKKELTDIEARLDESENLARYWRLTYVNLAMELQETTNSNVSLEVQNAILSETLSDTQLRLNCVPALISSAMQSGYMRRIKEQAQQRIDRRRSQKDKRTIFTSLRSVFLNGIGRLGEHLLIIDTFQ